MEKSVRSRFASNSFLILQTKSIGASFVVTIVIYAGFNMMAALISYPAGSLSDRWSRRNILLASFVIFFVAYLGFAWTKSVIAIAVLFLSYGLFQGIFRSVGKALASDFVPELLRASAVGWYSAVVGLLGLVASVVAGLLWDHISHAAVFYYGAIFAIAGSVGMLFIAGKRSRSAVAAWSLGCDWLVRE
ncbi:MAG TPA: MFS transporter [Candidatus Acidoferrum sp.]